jgi:hypothetical protein
LIIRSQRNVALLAAAVVALSAAGTFLYLHRVVPKASVVARRTEAAGFPFEDVTGAAGIHFIHNTGAFGQTYLPETLGSGVAFIDYNNDGYQDILLLNGRDWPGHPTKLAGSTMKLYRNNRDGTFTDVTHQAGLDFPIYAMGVAVGDYDNDGYDDLYITSLDGDRLLHNNGNGTFTDVTAKSHLNNHGFATSAAWVDYDRDGRLDLFVGNYVNWTPRNDIRCTIDGIHKTYCTPDAYNGESPRLYHNNGDGTFTDVTVKAGIYDPTCKSLGVTVFDYDGDGWPDIFVANDTQPNKLYHNNRNGTFTESAVSAGLAFSEDGVARGGMGTDAADFDHSGRFSVIIGNFANQMLGLYHNEGNGLFVDEAPTSDVGRASLLSLSFGTFFFDYDLDGLPDIFVANGHLDPDINSVQPRVTYAEPPLLFHNLGGGHFEVAKSGPELGRAIVARGAAYGDFDLDGYPDLLISTNNGPAYLYRNMGGANHSLRLRTIGVRSDRDGIGALVRVHTSTGWQEEYVKSGSSYCSANELPLTFGLGRDEVADAVEIHWPSGLIERLAKVAGDRFITVTEGRGITAAQPLRKPEALAGKATDLTRS